MFGHFEWFVFPSITQCIENDMHQICNKLLINPYNQIMVICKQCDAVFKMFK